MLFVYGGAFLFGAASMYPGEELALNGDVIVITFNYRVGIIGWLSTGDDNTAGNGGLWDAAAALSWVSENIGNFRGDPKFITIFGQSAGATSVSHMLLSPITNGLFKRMISISGGCTSFMGINNMYLSSAHNTARLYGCPSFPHAVMIKCLKRKPATWMDIYGIAGSLVRGGHIPTWGPIMDGDFIPIHPRVAFESGVGSNHDILLGNTHHDGAGFVLLNFLGLPQGNNLNWVAHDKAFMLAVLRFILGVFGNPAELVDAIVLKYPGLDSDESDVRTLTATQAITDYLFASPVFLQANLHSK